MNIIVTPLKLQIIFIPERNRKIKTLNVLFVRFSIKLLPFITQASACFKRQVFSLKPVVLANLLSKKVQNLPSFKKEQTSTQPPVHD